VQVSGQELTSGGVLIEVSDSGVGIPEARLAEINWRLDNPPVIDVSVSRHMGLFAVARLAERHAVRVRLRARAPHGLTALVWLPDTVIERGRAQAPSWAGRLEPQPATAGRQSAGRHSVPVPVGPDGQPSTDQFEAITSAAAAATVPGPVGPASPAGPAGPAGPREPAHAASAARSAGAASAASAATSDWFRSRRPSVTDPAGNGGGSPGGQSGSFAAAAQAGGQRSFGTGGWAEGRQAAQIVADPVRGDRTTAGLPMRVPRANLLPGSAGGAHRAGAPSRAAAHVPQVPAAPRPPRSPDIARTRLSGFQSGVRRAKSDTTRAGEGADR
jgi:hypothetical protein